MVHFSKLRLHGFKSFVEKTELEIGPGLTGIVGPNGCGKSNLVEALKWSMGETSAKRMRGGTGSMDDVIFNGTERRPARNSAEVSILLDNRDRSARGEWNEGDEIEINRRIERENGSDYRINGKPVRARDVQTLYADLKCGATSPFLISQGKVTDLIRAKPLDRRQILEEAAGITGLYARRHEAELKLRATDNNLKRLDDLVGGMDVRLNALKKQARQATRYRNLSAQIRQLEVMISSLEWKRAAEKLQDIERAFGEAESIVAERTITVSQLTQTQQVQSEDLPGLRQTEAEMSAALQALKITLQRLEDEAQRVAQQLDESETQLRQVRLDRDHEQVGLGENKEVLDRLAAEESDLLARQESEQEDLRQREEIRQNLQNAVAALETEYTALMEKNAADRARRQSLEQKAAQDTARRDFLRDRLGNVKSQLDSKKSSQDGGVNVEELRSALASIEQSAEALRTELKSLEAQLEESRTARDQARTDLQNAEREKAKIESEISALQSIVSAQSEEGFKPVFEDIRAAEGFELALSRALGDTLMASTDEAAPISWRFSNVTGFDLPAGVQALAPHVNAPQALALALSQIGVVDSEDQGNSISSQLKPGQSLVSRDGGYWRWDGLRVRVTASDRHAVTLQQKNRLAELQRQLPSVEQSVVTKRQALEQIESALSQTQSSVTEKQLASRQSEQQIRDQRVTLDRTVTAQAARLAELAKLEEAISLAEGDLKALEITLSENVQALESFDDTLLAAQQEKIESVRQNLSQERDSLNAAVSAYEVSRQENGRRQGRLESIGVERESLESRIGRSSERVEELNEREQTLTAKIEELSRRPDEIAKDGEVLLSKITAQEQEKAVVSDKLAAVEGELAATNKALKEAEGLLSEAREARAHAQATVGERQTHLAEVRTFIQEQFNMSPEELSAQAAISDEAMPNLEELKAQKEKDIHSRDLIGAVNLMADQEAEDLEKELGAILAEKNDLIEAINELRGGINKLNAEARERLNNAFNEVNAHFQDMFGRLFQGGKAHLALTEAEDPLEAGLEIFAQPPGKALQSLSLLSGGEQTLTAVALIFAMFMTNPSPICVMDEVDAPLDDANVDRFCNLLDQIAARGETRFLLITHHRMTMARMNRLYGVTMSERGVSQLVSVDMNQQLDFLEAA